MRVDTNELKYFDNDIDAIKEGFELLPEELYPAAKKALRGKKSVIISKNSGGKLSKWAAKRRTEKLKDQKMVCGCNEYYSELNKGGL